MGGTAFLYETPVDMDDRKAAIVSDAYINEAMAMTYEQGLQEIDDFFSSPKRPASVNNDNHVVEHQHSATAELQQDPLPDVLQGTNENDSVAYDTQVVSTIPATPLAVDDDFATLMEDIEQVISVAHDVPQPNPKSQLDYILNTDPDLSPEHNGTEAGQNDLQTLTNTDSTTVQLAIRNAAETKPLYSQEFSSDMRARQMPPLEKKPSELSVSKSSSAPIQPSHQPGSLASIDPPKGLSLPLPRRELSLQQLVIATVQQPDERRPRQSPELIASLQSQTGATLSSPTHARSLGSPFTPKTSQTPIGLMMPSNVSKDSMMEEMPEEESDSTPGVNLKTPAPDLKHGLSQDNIAERRDSAIFDATAVDMDAKSEEEQVVFGSSSLTGPPDVVRSMDEALGIEEDIEINADEDRLSLTDRLQPAVDDESDTDLSDVPDAMEEPLGKDEDIEDHRKRVVTALHEQDFVEDTMEMETQSRQVSPSGRRAARHQQTTRKQQPTPRIAADHNKDDTHEPASLVPSKRKMRETTPKPANKKQKAARAPAMPARSGKKLENESQSPSEGASPATPKQKHGTKPLGKREMQDLLWPAVQKHVSPGGRKSRAQTEKEAKKREEEARKVPNAGRAAKERHKGKGA